MISNQNINDALCVILDEESSVAYVDCNYDKGGYKRRLCKIDISSLQSPNVSSFLDLGTSSRFDLFDSLALDSSYLYLKSNNSQKMQRVYLSTFTIDSSWEVVVVSSGPNIITSFARDDDFLYVVTARGPKPFKITISSKDKNEVAANGLLSLALAKTKDTLFTAYFNAPNTYVRAIPLQTLIPNEVLAYSLPCFLGVSDDGIKIVSVGAEEEVGYEVYSYQNGTINSEAGFIDYSFSCVAYRPTTPVSVIDAFVKFSPVLYQK